MYKYITLIKLLINNYKYQQYINVDSEVDSSNTCLQMTRIKTLAFNRGVDHMETEQSNAGMVFTCTINRCMLGITQTLPFIVFRHK